MARAKLTVAEAGARGGKARGRSKVRGDSAFYSALSGKRWGPPPPAPAVADLRADAAAMYQSGEEPSLPRPATRRALRNTARISAELAGKLCGVSRQTLHLWEGGAEPLGMNRLLYAALLRRLDAQRRRKRG